MTQAFPTYSVSLSDLQRHPDFAMTATGDNAGSSEYWAHRCGVAEGELLRRGKELDEVRDLYSEKVAEASQLAGDLRWKEREIDRLKRQVESA